MRMMEAELSVPLPLRECVGYDPILPTLRCIVRTAPMTAKLDAVTLEVIRNALPAVANEM